MNYYIGMDVGATNMRIKIADESGKPLVMHEGEGCTVNVAGYDYVAKVYRRELETALEKANLKPEDCICLCAGACGIDSPALHAQYMQLVQAVGFAPEKLKLYNDCEVLLHIKEDANVIAIVSGTGSIVMGRSLDGAQERYGGRGHLLGDEGSAFYIVKEAFVRMIRFLDGYGDCELLCRRFTEASGLHTPIELKKFYQDNCIVNKSLISQYAPLVTEAAENGDPGAREIMEAAAQGLYMGFSAVEKKLQLSADAPLHVIYWGSILEKVPLIANRLAELIHADAPQAQITLPTDSALDTALHIAMRG